MSDNTYKVQAQRLAAYLAAVHGIKIKNSSILEAVAAMHGARDWNSLVGAPKEAAPATENSVSSRAQALAEMPFDSPKWAYAGAFFAELQLASATVLTVKHADASSSLGTGVLHYEAPGGNVTREVTGARAEEVTIFLRRLAKMQIDSPVRHGEFTLSDEKATTHGLVVLQPDGDMKVILRVESHTAESAVAG